MQEVMKLTQSKIEQQTGKHISIADMQALLWYQEKELFNTLGAANKRSAPSDYEDAAQEAVRNSIENKLGFNRISPNYKITSNRMIKNERSGIYHDIGANTMARQFDSDQQKTVSRLLKQAVALGVPSEMVSGIKGFVASAGRKDSIARYYMNGPLAGHVMIDEALVNAAGMGGDVAKHAERTVLQNLVHEMAHAIDHAHSVDGMYSDHSPLFATERNKNGKIKYTGEVINELYNAWRDSTPLAYELSYPFDPSFDYPANVQRVEAFAQAAMLHFTEPELLAKHAPKTSAMFKEMFNDYESRSNQGKRFPAPVQEALRTDSVGAFDFESVASRPRIESQRGNQDEQARAGAGAGSDGLGRELKPPAVKTVKIADLDLHPDGLATAKSKFMWEPKYRHENTAPIAVENRNGKLHVLDGYHRVVQAMRDGNKEIEVIEHQSPSDQTFDPNNPSIIYSRSSRYFNSMPPPGVGMDGATIPNENTISHLTAQASKRVDAYREVAGKNIDKFRTLFQDYFLPVQRAQDRIAAAGGKITEDTDVAGREEVYYGRTGEQLKQLEDKHVKPLISEMARLGVSQEDLELYAYAKFAPDRNARIAKINPKFPDGGSGMTNADAAQVLSDFKDNGMDKKLEPLWTRLQAMNESRVATLENAGLISKDEAAMWRSEKNYVPLKGVAEGTEDAGFQRTGQGFSIGGKEAHRALGRQSRATDIIANAIAQGEAAIIRAEKNRVATALLRLAQDNPNENLWSVDRVAEKPTFNENTGEVSYKKDSLHRLRDNVVQVKVDGEQHFVTLHDKQLAESMKNLGAAKMGAFLRAFSSLNRFFSLTRTTLAPEFVLANFSRDLQTAAINLSGEQSASMAAAVVKDVPNAIKAMYLHNRGNNPGGSWGREVQEFAAEGGMTNFVAQRTVEEQQKKIEGLLKEAKGGVVGGARKLVREVFGFVEDVNGAVENGVRLSAYSNARRAGMSKQDAARLAKNLTVNFNKKGSAGPALNALYMFYNASMQGSARFLTALKSPKVQKIMAATAVAGYAISMMNRSNAGDDDDGQNRFDKIPDWEKARNIIIFEPGGGGKYLKIPMPYTYNLPYLIGTSMESMINGKAKASSAAANITNAMLTSFNPIGDYDVRADSSQQIEKLASPTALDPLVDIVNNRNFFGAPISPEVSPFDKSPDPDSQRYFASTNPQAVWLADKLNSLTGGDKVKSGGIDVSPASMVYLFDYLTGGSGAFGERMATAISLAAKGEPVPSYKIPFYRVFAGELNEARVSQTYYAARDDVNQRIAEFKLGRAVGFDTESARTDALVGQQLNGLLLSTDKRMKLLRDRRKKADALGDEKTVDDIKVRERALQLRFAKAYFAKLGENE